MGGAVSAGEDNDDLIDNLLNAEFIKTPLVERILRVVDRAAYYEEGFKSSAYEDVAWKRGNLHLSAPCIYSEVLEALQLSAGMSFLNLGSGTGYLSTMAGLFLGPYGVNQGVELHPDVVQYAEKKLGEFMQTSPALDEFDFCLPTFVVGNCLLLDLAGKQFDRVYCGASCPEVHETFMKGLLRIGGILVMPFGDQLLQITRVNTISWVVKPILPVTFASLVSPTTDEPLFSIKLPECHPMSLKEIARHVIRQTLRHNVESENPNLKQRRENKLRSEHVGKRIRRIMLPLFDSDGSDSNQPRPSSASRGSSSSTSEEENEEPCDFTGSVEGKRNTDLKSVGSGTNKAVIEDDLLEERESLLKKIGSHHEVMPGPSQLTCAEKDKKLSSINEVSNESHHSNEEQFSGISDDEEDKQMNEDGRRESDISDLNFCWTNSTCSDREDSEIDGDNNSKVLPRKRAASPRDKTEEFDGKFLDEKKKLTYMHLMLEKIKIIPLPIVLKNYLNYDRPFPL